jgi:GMP synthase-like glutamine amidotransferase
MKLAQPKILAFQHVPWETPGRIGEAVGRKGGEIGILHPADTRRAASVYEACAALVVMGGPMSANDDLDYLREEMRLMERALADAKPILGVCLGAQLLAKTLGARVYPNRVKEIGWGTVTLTEAAAADPLFHGLPEAIDALHWHGETFDLPRGAELLASSDACVNQAFRVGKNAWGLQFHIEATPDMIRNWLAEPLMCGDLAYANGPIEPAGGRDEIARTVFDRWVSRIGSVAYAVVS